MILPCTSAHIQYIENCFDILSFTPTDLVYD